MDWSSVLGGVVGGIAGGQGDKTHSNTNTDYAQNLNLQSFDQLNKGQSGLEANAYNTQLSSFSDLSQLIGMGPGSSAVQSNNQYQDQYSGQLAQMLQRLNSPTAANVQQNYAQAQQVFAPQQVALNQQFTQANVDSNRLAARLGRAGNDPILRNKLMQEQTRQQTMLNAQQGSYAAQLPQQQAQNLLQVGGALSNLRQGLATQALTNRQTLLGIGGQLTAAERQYRIQTAQKTGSQTSNTNNKSGGGLGDMISGVLGGVGEFAGMFGSAAGGAVSTTASGFGGMAGGAGDAIGGAGAAGAVEGAGTTAVEVAPYAAAVA